MDIPEPILRAELRRLYDQLGTAYIQKAAEMKARPPSEAGNTTTDLRIATVVRSIKDLQDDLSASTSHRLAVLMPTDAIPRTSL